MWEVLATEAAKTVTATMSGVLITGAGTVLRLLRRRRPTLPDDPQELAALIATMGERDPAFVSEIAEAMAAAGSGTNERSISPAILPPPWFVDRDSARAHVAEPGVWVIAGAYGVGKTALALRVLQDVAERFPSGHAYIDLDDYRDGDCLRLGDVMVSVLRQLGVDVASAALPELTEQYLRALVYRRFVLILDNVLGAAEARSLAQPWPASLVLVTTRMLGDDLRMWSPTEPVILNGLDESGAWQLLERRCGRYGQGMLAAEPRAAVALLELCDRMPYAIAQVGVWLSRRAGEPGVVSAMLEEFRHETGADGVIYRCVSQTVAELSPATTKALIILAAHPGDAFSYATAEAMVGRPVRDTLDELTDACLVTRTPQGKLRLHHLVRAYALRLRSNRERDREPDQEPDQEPEERLLRYVRDAAVAADLAMDIPGRQRLRRYEVPVGLTWPPLRVTPQTRPIDWLDAEVGLIADLAERAYHQRHYREVCQLCGALEVVLTHRGRHWLIEGANRWGILAARELGQPALEARLHGIQGRIYTQLHQLPLAGQALDTAFQLLAGVDDPRLRSSTLEFQARWYEESGDLAGAVDRFRECLIIDERPDLVRGRGLHQRMLANVLIKAGRAGEAIAILAQAATNTSDPRNLARVLMVSARAHAAMGDAGRANAELGQARDLVVRTGSTQYDLELADIEAQIALLTGNIEAAKARWGWIAQMYCNVGHPKFDEYLVRLNQLNQLNHMPLPPG